MKVVISPMLSRRQAISATMGLEHQIFIIDTE